jgi:FtsZ-binding cell division protein ZapB
MVSQELEIDSLASLEDRILKAVELVSRLRAEKEAAEREATEARAMATRVALEMEQLRSERKHVRTRIEKLLGQMDLLSGE